MKTRSNGPCECDVLRKLSEHVDSPIQWDSRMHEFYIRSGEKGKILIYFCPFCGGSTPESKRASFFETVSDEEIARIFAALEAIRDTTDLVSQVGKPDETIEFSAVIPTQSPETISATSQIRRHLIYENLSSVADVVIEEGSDGRILRKSVQKKSKKGKQKEEKV